MSGDLYAVVYREINGRPVRTIERMSSDDDVCFFDCAVVYSGDGASSIGGLFYLEGETVSIIADGGSHADQVVENGRVYLDGVYTDVVIGLRKLEKMTTLPQILEQYPGLGIGAVKNISRAMVRVSGDAGITVGAAGGQAIEHLLRGNSLMTGTPATSGDAVLDIPLMPSWTDDGSIEITNESGRQVTVISIAYELAISG